MGNRNIQKLTFNMSEMERPSQASQYLHNLHSMLAIAGIDPADASLLGAVLALAEAYLSLAPSITSNTE
ncbi:hypothetical protein [Leptolyngbya sp. 7M]|uniref:hypothetical protein n=1 Tax=Leptolyngbya sp. 7M TaxID=2812896 RepID=UPI001B8B188B|nr:hypothetical protein [Leptolyngbya sp. 7M]QYO67776.1 hypothetical protein JVX88_13885 [Leptolyngbya sp. 7M]